MIIITGGAGFIGSCVVSRLNTLGHSDLIVVDHLNELKNKNLEGKKFLHYFDKKDFLELLKDDRVDLEVRCIIHLGACSSTTLDDARYFEENNFAYSCHVADWALKHQARLIYASSAATYGDGSSGYQDEESSLRQLKPLNLYGQSKQKFDEWVFHHHAFDKIAGLKFFNVFGPNEYHKGEMRSVIAKAYDKVVSEGKISLFKSYNPKYKDGEQQRDFIYVKDSVDIVMYFFEHPEVNGLFNIGTGRARTWNDLAQALFTAVNKPAKIEYIDMPEAMRPKYQYFTQAQMQKLRNAGYQKPFTTLEEAVKDYVGYLKMEKNL